MKIRILHVIDHLGYGGASVVVKNIVEGLNSENIEAFVCALRTNPMAIPIKAKLINLSCYRYNPCTILAIAKLCKKYKIDIIHAHLQKSIISSLIASFLCNSKVVIHEHGAIFRGGTGFIYRLLLKVFGSRAAVAIVNSRATKAALSRSAGFAKESIHIIGNFVDFARFDCTLYDRDKARNTFGIAENKTVVGFVGRLDHCKGADLLVNAAAILCKKDQRYRFVVVGEGTQRKQLKRLVLRLGLKEKVIFTGLCRNPAEVIRAFDIAVVPSRREAFGITVIEFMRMKIPVIASAVGGLVELVTDGVTGLITHENRPNEIADAVQRLANGKKLRQHLIDNAYNFSEKFNVDEHVKKIEKIYERVYD
ncbi:MAG: hypothetical protein DRP62_07985 [Planctomycetota bacterium]|nr:MAG: hypothetical protein DRP62_07985 [Planctomycetota bacterium]